MIPTLSSEINSCLSRFDVDYRHFIRKTPLWVLPGKALGVGCAQVWLKLEHLQSGGSFKTRGALHRLLSNNLPTSGVVIASGGNAGIATALAAQLLGVPCEVFLPEATVTVTGAAYADAYAACLARQQVTGALLNHAYDQRDVVVGAGTIAAEVQAQQGLPDTWLVSVGGGGLIAGIAAYVQAGVQGHEPSNAGANMQIPAHAQSQVQIQAQSAWCKKQGERSHSKVIAIEPELAPTLHAARAAGQPVDVAVSGIAADSLGAKRIGHIGWQVAQTAVYDALLVSDDAIRTAQRWLWQELKLAVEPAAALGFAALQTGAYKPKADETICLVLCGANIDPASLVA
jgi:threonine dehydratase